MLDDRVVISSFEQLFVGQCEGPGQLSSTFRDQSEAVYGLDMRFDLAACNIRPLTN